MLSFLIRSSDIREDIYIPKYYDTDLQADIRKYKETHACLVLGDLIDRGIISVTTGDEIGKMAYGTGDIPFVRTSDISNWELKSIPKQGVSKEVYDSYSEKQDVRPGDILMVRDGSYLIGVSCMIHDIDLPLLFQSHILKFRVEDDSVIDSNLLLLALNSDIAQRQIRSFQFTADIIDTIGNRYRELLLFIPKEHASARKLSQQAEKYLNDRVGCKMLLRQFPKIVMSTLHSGNTAAFDDFFKASYYDAKRDLVRDTSALEFGSFICSFVESTSIHDNILIPKYYDPSIRNELESLKHTCDLLRISELEARDVLSLSTGDEIGKMAYGTGEVPFIRTSDFSNWEIKHDAKQRVSKEIYNDYANRQDVQENDILVVRDGTYLVGTTCIITSSDTRILYCGGLIKVRSNVPDYLDPYLLLALLNSYIVKRQIRSKQFTRDVIDTLGNRFSEVILPIPKDGMLRSRIAYEVQQILETRIFARDGLLQLAQTL